MAGGDACPTKSYFVVPFPTNSFFTTFSLLKFVEKITSTSPIGQCTNDADFRHNDANFRHFGANFRQNGTWVIDVADGAWAGRNRKDKMVRYFDAVILMLDKMNHFDISVSSGC